MKKISRLVLVTNILSSLGFCTTVSDVVNIQSSTLNLGRKTTITEQGKIIIGGNSTFNQNSKTLENQGTIDISTYSGASLLSMDVTGIANGEQGLILGTSTDQLSAKKISSISVSSNQTVHYYYTTGGTKYIIDNELGTDNLIKLVSQPISESGINYTDYTTVTASQGGNVNWKNDGPNNEKTTNATITDITKDAQKNISENTLDVTTEGLEPVLNAGNQVNVKLKGSKQITFEGTSDTISDSDIFIFAGDNSGLQTQILPANATIEFIGNKSLFPFYDIISENAIGNLVFGNGTSSSENSLSGKIFTKKLEVKQNATLIVSSGGNLTITDDGSEISGKINVKDGGIITF